VKTSLISDLLESNYRLLKSLHPLRRVTLEITNQCNLQCRHCYMSASLASSPDLLTFEEIKRFAEELKKHFGAKIPISITGGEPFLRKDIYKILEYFKKLGFQTTIATNALLIDDKDIPKLKNLVTEIAISLDGEEEDHDFLRDAFVFRKVLKKIEAIKASEIPLTIKTVVFKRNQNKLLEIYENLITKIKPYQWHLIPIMSCGAAQKNRDLCISNFGSKNIYKQIEKIVGTHGDEGVNIILGEGDLLFKKGKLSQNREPKRCHAGITMMSVLFNGDVVPCINGRHGKVDVQGNIRYNDVRKLWKNGFKKNRNKSYYQCSSHEV